MKELGFTLRVTQGVLVEKLVRASMKQEVFLGTCDSWKHREVDMKIVNNDEEFKENAVVLFGSISCAPCKAVTNIFDSIASQYPNVKFLKVIVDENKELAMQFEVETLPTVYFYKNGMPITKFCGMKGKSYIIDIMRNYYDN